MKTTGTLTALALLLACMLAILYAWQCADRPSYRFPEWTPAEKRELNKHIGPPTFYTAIRTSKGVTIRTENGVIWIGRE